MDDYTRDDAAIDIFWKHATKAATLGTYELWTWGDVGVVTDQNGTLPSTIMDLDTADDYLDLLGAS